MELQLLFLPPSFIWSWELLKSIGSEGTLHDAASMRLSPMKDWNFATKHLFEGLLPLLKVRSCTRKSNQLTVLTKLNLAKIVC